MNTNALVNRKSSTGTEDKDEFLFWEPIAKSRWGRYISTVEESMIRYAIRQSPNPSMSLDIGAEGGRWSKLLCDAGWTTICTDIKQSALDVCQQRIPTAKCILVDKGSQTFPCEDDSIGILLAIEVHELLEQDWFVRESARVLKTDGLLVGVFQNACSWRAVVKNWFPDRNESFKHYTASYRTWRRFAKQHKLEIVREKGICWMPFGRKSDSPLIPLAVRLERYLGLQTLTSVSPWIIFVAKKIAAAGKDDHCFG